MIHGIGLREERYEIGHEFTRALEIVGRVPIEIEAPQSIPQIPATAFNDGLCDSRGDLTDFVGCRHRKIICRNFKTKFDRDLGHHTEYTVGGWARNFMDSDEVRRRTRTRPESHVYRSLEIFNKNSIVLWRLRRIS